MKLIDRFVSRELLVNVLFAIAVLSLVLVVGNIFRKLLPLLVTELVFGLLLRKVWIGQAIRPAAWGSAALTCVALAGFVLVDQPQGGTPTPAAHAWVGALAAFGGAAAVMTLAARWGSPRIRT